jgi:hypothetical protein
MSPAVFVPMLVIGILAINACIWIPIILVTKRKNAERAAALEAELRTTAAKGERLLCGPTYARVLRGHGTGRAMVALTNERLVVMSSARTDIPLGDVDEVRAAGVFNTNVRAGYDWLVVRTKSLEIGISLRSDEHTRWLEAAKRVLAERA